MTSHAGASESLIDKIHLTLKQIFEKATAEYIIDRNSALSLEVPRGTTGERRPLTEDETDATLKVAAMHKGGLLLYLLYYWIRRKLQRTRFYGKNFFDGCQMVASEEAHQ